MAGPGWPRHLRIFRILPSPFGDRSEYIDCKQRDKHRAKGRVIQTMPEAVVVRCPSCGAPLAQTGGTFIVKCSFCDSECRLASKEAEAQARETSELFSRMRESERIEAEVRPKIDELNEKMSGALAEGKREKAVRYFEGIMRLETLASQNLMGDSFNYLDEVVVPAVSDFAKSMGVEYPFQPDHE